MSPWRFFLVSGATQVTSNPTPTSETRYERCGDRSMTSWTSCDLQRRSGARREASSAMRGFRPGPALFDPPSPAIDSRPLEPLRRSRLGSARNVVTYAPTGCAVCWSTSPSTPVNVARLENARRRPVGAIGSVSSSPSLSNSVHEESSASRRTSSSRCRAWQRPARRIPPSIPSLILVRRLDRPLRVVRHQPLLHGLLPSLLRGRS